MIHRIKAVEEAPYQPNMTSEGGDGMRMLQIHSSYVYPHQSVMTRSNPPPGKNKPNLKLVKPKKEYCLD
jgi:hypothetical protein